VVRYRRRWTLGVVIVMATAAWMGSQLNLHLDADDFLPSSTGTSAALDREILGRYGGTGRVVVFLESEERIDAGEVAQLFDHLAERIGRVDGVRSVQYRLEPELQGFLERHGPELFLLYLEPLHLRVAGERLSREGIERALLAPADSQRASLAERLTDRERDPLGLLGLAASTVQRATGRTRIRVVDGYFSFSGGRRFFFTVEPEPGIDDIEKARILVRGIDGALEEARTDPALARLLEGRRTFAVGRPVSYVSAFETAYGDIRRIALAATFVVFVLLALFFRRALAPFVLLLPIACGFALTAAAGFVLFGSVSLIAWIFAGVLVGLGVDFGLHITTHYWVYGEPGAERAEAVASAVARPGRGILFGGLTSAAAFSSLQVVSYPAMRQLAWLTGIGLLAIMAASFVVLPIALSHFRSETRSETLWGRWGGIFDRASSPRRTWTALFWVVLLIAAVMAFPAIPFEPHPWKLALRGNPKSAELERLNRELGSAFTPILIVSQGATRDEAIARDREAARLLSRIALQARIASVESLSGWLPASEDQLANIRFIRENRELFDPARFRSDFEDVVSRLEEPDPYLTEEYLPLITRSLGTDKQAFTLDDLRRFGLDAQIDRHLLERPREHLAISFIYLRQFPWAEGSVSRFLDVFDRAGGNDLAGVRVMGEALRSASHGEVLRRDALLATSLALMLVAGILWVQFRRLLESVLCLLPLACGIGAALLVMAVLRIELNMLTLAVAPILVGIGVDDGIHMVGRLHGGEPPQKVLQKVLREAGSSMTMTTLTTVAAFACLGLATFDGIREVGLVGSVGLLVCLLASLHLVPLAYRAAQRAIARRPR
jgi:predicted exporter